MTDQVRARGLGLVISLTVLVSACNPASTPTPTQRVVQETVVVTRVVEKIVTVTPAPIPTPSISATNRVAEKALTATPAPFSTPVSSNRPTVSQAAGALQELVATLILRTGYEQVSNVGGTANLYVVYVDEGVRQELVAYQAALEDRDVAYQQKTLRQLEQRIRERNEQPMLLFIQPAEGTSIRFREPWIFCPHAGLPRVPTVTPIGRVPETPTPGPDLGDTCEGQAAILPTRFDSVFRGDVTSDTVGFFYFPYLTQQSVPVVDQERSPTLGFGLEGGLGNGRTHLGWRPYFDKGRCAPSCEDLMGKWPYFAALIYIDLLPTEKPLKLLPDVVAEYIVGARPLASPPRGFDVNVQWDLSGRDILQIVDLLLRLLTILGVGG